MTPAAILSILVKTQGVAAAQSELRGLDSSAHKTSGSIKGALVGAAKAGAFAVAAAGAAAAGAGAKMISLASDAEETASKFKTVFGREAGSATKALDEFSKATGTSKFALREQAAQLQALIRPMGLNTKNAAGMSVGLTKLATDLASFNNSSVDEAITALQSGLVGEAEPLRRFGVQLSAARVETFAYAKGIAKQGEELTAAQKAQASYAIILEDTKLAQGDAARTADSFANQWKRLKSQVTDLATELGVKLLPIASKVVGAITDFIGKFKEGSGTAGGFKDAIVTAWNAAKSAVQTGVAFVKGWIDKHRDDLDAARKAAENIGKAIQWAFENVALPVIQRVLPVIRQFVTSTFEQIGGIIDVIVGLLTGDFSRAWEGVQAIVKGALDKTLALLGLAWDAFKAAGKLLLDAVVAGFKALPGLLLDLGTWIEDQFDKGVKAVLQGILAIGKWLLARVIDGIKAGAQPLINLGDWVKDRLFDGLKAVVDAVKALGKWLLDRVVDGWKLQAQLLIDLGGWVKNRIMDGLSAALEGIKALGAWVLDKVVDGLRARADLVTALAGWLKNRFMDGLEAAVEAIKGLGGWVLDKIIEGLRAVGGKVRAAVVAIKDAIVDAIKDVFKGALSIPLKISLPKIDLPFGGSGGGNVGPGSGRLPSHVSGFDDDARGFGNVVTSGYRRGDDGWHGQNRARDYAGGNMLGFARYMAANFGGRLLELIHTPLGFGIKNGQRVPLSFWGGAVNADHFDHVHVALANGGYLKRGGWAVVGERGPELAHLPSGASVYSNRDSRGMIGGGPQVINLAVDFGEGVKRVFQIHLDEYGRQTRGQYLAGRLT